MRGGRARGRAARAGTCRATAARTSTARPAPAPGAGGSVAARRSRSCSRRPEAHDRAVVLLDDRAALGEQVDVAEDLRQREEGLRERDVPPQALRDLVGTERLVGDEL